MRNALMTQGERQKIKITIRNSLLNYVTRFSYTAKHPLDALIPTERKIRSLVGGLETSIGTKLWEPIAKVLAVNNDFEVLGKKLKRPEPMPIKLQLKLDYLITARENKSTWLDRNEVVKEFRDIAKTITQKERTSIKYVDPAPGTGVDIYLTKGNKYYAFDIKTVQPNVGGIKAFNKQLLEWYAYAIFENPKIEFSAQIAYPYNPRVGDFWSRSPHKSGALQPTVDALVEDEFWDFISGNEGTFCQIMEIFEELKMEGLGERMSKIIKTI